MRFQIDAQDLEQIPQELRDRFPDVMDDLRTGVIDEVPEQVLDQLPSSVVDRIPESLLASDLNTTFVIVLVAIAVLALAGFAYGIMKAAIKASVFFLIVAAIAGAVLYWQF